MIDRSKLLGTFASLLILGVGVAAVAGAEPSLSTQSSGAPREGGRVEHRERAGAGTSKVVRPDAAQERRRDRRSRELPQGGSLEIGGVDSPGGEPDLRQNGFESGPRPVAPPRR